ncbi:MAG: response regulator [Tepidisphaeraceae bacterium]|jgi:DNA-binding NtrC family response regulator
MTHQPSREPVEDCDSPGILSPRSASQRVLIVEDERRLREMLHATILEMGLHPTGAPSGESALKLAGQQFFALAVVDLNLPGINGLELCERLLQQNPHLQIVILTGFGDLDAARQAIRLQVVDFLIKPCGMDELENALNRARLRWLDRSAVDSTSQSPQGVGQTPAAPAPPVAADASTQRSIDDMERELILAALTRHNGNRQEAAAELGISVRKLYYRIHQYQALGLITPD